MRSTVKQDLLIVAMMLAGLIIALALSQTFFVITFALLLLCSLFVLMLPYLEDRKYYKFVVDGNQYLIRMMSSTKPVRAKFRETGNVAVYFDFLIENNQEYYQREFRLLSGDGCLVTEPGVVSGGTLGTRYSVGKWSSDENTQLTLIPGNRYLLIPTNTGFILIDRTEA